jgi:pimeloyl-ACP methyl ester carboxylesterase
MFADDFREVTVPVLYLTGTQDRLLAPAVVRALQGLRSDLEVAALDAPHFFLQRRPAEAADVISRFLLRCAEIRTSSEPEGRHAQSP